MHLIFMFSLYIWKSFHITATWDYPWFLRLVNIFYLPVKIGKSFIIIYLVYSLISSVKVLFILPIIFQIINFVLNKFYLFLKSYYDKTIIGWLLKNFTISTIGWESFHDYMKLSLQDYSIKYRQEQLQNNIKNSFTWLPINIRKLIYGNQILFILIFLIFCGFFSNPFFFRGVINSVVNLQLSKATSSSGEISKMFQKTLSLLPEEKINLQEMQKGFSKGSEVLNKNDPKTLANTYKYGIHEFFKNNNLNKSIGSHFDDASQKLTHNNNINKYSEIKTCARLSEIVEDFAGYTDFNQYPQKLLIYPGRPDGVIVNKNNEFISNYDLTEPSDLNNMQNLNNFHENKLTKYHPNTKLIVFSNHQFEEYYNKINKNKNIILLSNTSKLEDKIHEEQKELLAKINELHKEMLKKKFNTIKELINELENNSDLNDIFGCQITVSETDLNNFLLEDEREIDDFHKKIIY